MKFDARGHGRVRGRRPGSIRTYPRRRQHVGPAPIGLSCLFAVAALAGCSMRDGVGSLIVDPGRYSVYHCKDLGERLQDLLERQTELRNLMQKASEGGGGAVIGALSYRTEYEKELSEEKLLRRTAAEKKCTLGPPVLRSDQVIQ